MDDENRRLVHDWSDARVVTRTDQLVVEDLQGVAVGLASNFVETQTRQQLETQAAEQYKHGVDWYSIDKINSCLRLMKRSTTMPIVLVY